MIISRMARLPCRKASMIPAQRDARDQADRHRHLQAHAGRIIDHQQRLPRPSQVAGLHAPLGHHAVHGRGDPGVGQHHIDPLQLRLRRGVRGLGRGLRLLGGGALGHQALHPLVLAVGLLELRLRRRVLLAQFAVVERHEHLANLHAVARGHEDFLHIGAQPRAQRDCLLGRRCAHHVDARGQRLLGHRDQHRVRRQRQARRRVHLARLHFGPATGGEEEEEREEFPISDFRFPIWKRACPLDGRGFLFRLSGFGNRQSAIGNPHDSFSLLNSPCARSRLDRAIR
jgi:hypothetical protein